MKMKRWVLATLLVGGAVLGFRAQGGCLRSSQAPDQELVDHIDDMCDIARDNVDTPERGVRKLGRFLTKHAGDMTGELVDTIALIERIDDDARHDERARIARDRIHGAFGACAEDWLRFIEAVSADPDASAALEHAMERLSRTLEIILAGQQVDLRHLPQQLMHAFDR